MKKCGIVRKSDRENNILCENERKKLVRSKVQTEERPKKKTNKTVIAKATVEASAAVRCVANRQCHTIHVIKQCITVSLTGRYVIKVSLLPCKPTRQIIYSHRARFFAVTFSFFFFSFFSLNQKFCSYTHTIIFHFPGFASHVFTLFRCIVGDVCYSLFFSV